MIPAYLTLRAIFLLSALGVVVFCGRRAWRALRHPQPGDMVYLLFVGLAISRLVLLGKGIAYPNPPATQVEAALTFLAYVIGIAAEAGVVIRMRWRAAGD